jgi:type I restriction enzyme, S subunit
MRLFASPGRIRRGATIAFRDVVDGAFKQMDLNVRESSTLSTLRDTLLPKLLSGELPVPAALTATEEALA